MNRTQGDIVLDLSDVADALFKCIRSNATGQMDLVRWHLLDVEQAIEKTRTDLDIMQHPEKYAKDGD